MGLPRAHIGEGSGGRASVFWASLLFFFSRAEVAAVSFFLCVWISLLFVSVARPFRWFRLFLVVRVGFGRAAIAAVSCCFCLLRRLRHQSRPVAAVSWFFVSFGVGIGVWRRKKRRRKKRRRKKWAAKKAAAKKARRRKKRGGEKGRRRKKRRRKSGGEKAAAEKAAAKKAGGEKAAAPKCAIAACKGVDIPTFTTML